jgi:pimeloyl-ACP methyl ester carboxylesterase
VYASFGLDKHNPHVRRAFVVIHGADRNADTYFETAVSATAAAGASLRTVIVSPRFQTLEDGPAPDEPYWSSGGWKEGHLSSVDGLVPRVSSYAALDNVLEILTDRTRFPFLDTIVVAGHSAGGQVVHRFAATSAVQERTAGVVFRYVVANPSTYLYLRPERPAHEGFALPDEGACPDYDDWHYGLQERNSYAGSVPLDSIRVRLTTRDVRILLGDADSLSASLDVTCGANLQGAYRYERGLSLLEYMDRYFAGHRHGRMVAPGVGHSSRNMFLSDVGQRALFGG